MRAVLSELSSIFILESSCCMLCEVETNRFSDYLPLYQSGEATLGSDEYYQYDVYSIRVASRYGANPVPPTREDSQQKLL